MSNIHWLKTNNVFREVEGDFSTIDKLPVGIYNIGLTMQGWHLEKYADKFTFDYKMYGLQTEFCEHVLKTYKNTTGNFGIMLTGTKGTGKTVTAKTLANEFNLPVIIVKDMGSSNQAMIEFLSSLNFDCVLFLDEFEKNFSDKDSTILQIMDGVYNIGYRKIFLLTTNLMTVNENLIGRPSRIRYVKKFGNLDIKTVESYLDDELKVPEARQDWENCLRAQVERDYNHPSIFAWVNFNETWGLFDKDHVYTQDAQDWVRSMYHLTKSLDPSRLVEDQSALLSIVIHQESNGQSLKLRSMRSGKRTVERISTALLVQLLLATVDIIISRLEMNSTVRRL